MKVRALLSFRSFQSFGFCHNWTIQRVLAGMAVCLLMSSCSRTQPSHFYVLTPLAVPTAANGGSVKNELAISLGPVELPDYLDRPQIVTRTGPNAFDLAEFDRWAEPLEKNFSRVLLENLSAQLAADQVAVFAWNGTVPATYRVTVTVTSLYRETNGSVSLDARWMVHENTGKKDHSILFYRTSRLRESAEAEDYEEAVSAMSRAVEKLSAEMATAVRTLPRKKTP